MGPWKTYLVSQEHPTFILQFPISLAFHSKQFAFHSRRLQLFRRGIGLHHRWPEPNPNEPYFVHSAGWRESLLVIQKSREKRRNRTTFDQTWLLWESSSKCLQMRVFICGRVQVRSSKFLLGILLTTHLPNFNKVITIRLSQLVSFLFVARCKWGHPSSCLVFC